MTERLRPDQVPFPPKLGYNSELRYKIHAVVFFHGAPVNWNVRARIWSGADRREPLRRRIRRLSGHLPKKGRHLKALREFLFRAVDDRDFSYPPRVRACRRILNTQADVDARKARTDANKYWRAREQR